ncbi:hypothetical protein AZF06_01345 [Priestia endophytica]|jgi:hypothetical protein|uniref:hypothetical protein n=1 Tax=Priestia endophytica TaxID=135735 RepID=UPI00077C7533|nr:hypothetical protein AZF06_01345 [Priestia endophytica]MBG9814815.1 hypothetical protein [Priestia endophytica]
MFVNQDKKAKGEEKPEEELMGNVSLLRGWQQHLIKMLLIVSLSKSKKSYTKGRKKTLKESELVLRL